jgi:hypothetical protein
MTGKNVYNTERKWVTERASILLQKCCMKSIHKISFDVYLFKLSARQTIFTKENKFSTTSKRSSLPKRVSKRVQKMFWKGHSLCQFHKHFTHLTYSHGKINQCSLKTLTRKHASNEQLYRLFCNFLSWNKKNVFEISLWLSIFFTQLVDVVSVIKSMKNHHR